MNRNAVPSQRVNLALEIHAGRNPQRRLHVNDIRDVGFYKTAIPYANVIVTEKHWANAIRQTKLDAEFGTLALTKLTELPDALASVGCL